MAIRTLLAACLATAMLAACSDDRPDALPQAPESMQDVAAPADTPVADEAGAGLVAADPAGFCAAERRQQATISWDVRSLGAKHVTVHIGESPDSKVFFRGGPSGEKQTDAWVRPGMVFVVRNADNGEALGKVRIGSLDC